MEAEALIELSDIANSLSGDFHTMHLNIAGVEFDTMHKKVLKKYYEEAADDYDMIAEMARRKPWRTPVPSANSSAARIGWKSFEGNTSRENAVHETDIRLQVYLDAMLKVFNYFNGKTECPVSQGIASTLQDRLDFWSAEWGFFNEGRKNNVESKG